MVKSDPYREAHLLVAAIRILEYKKNTLPSIEEIGQALGFSTEQCHLLCNKLSDTGIIGLVEGPYGARVCIRDHLKIEDLPRQDTESGIEKEIKKFQDARKHFAQKIESLQAEQVEKKKSLFAELEKKLKADLGKEEEGGI